MIFWIKLGLKVNFCFLNIYIYIYKFEMAGKIEEVSIGNLEGNLILINDLYQKSKGFEDTRLSFET